MAKRMPNKERIQRRALEVAAKEKEKAEDKEKPKTKKKVAKAAPKTKKKEAAQTSTGLKVVWKIFNERLKEVATFPYPENAAAQAKAAALTKKSGNQHVVHPVKVPRDE